MVRASAIPGRYDVHLNFMHLLRSHWIDLRVFNVFVPARPPVHHVLCVNYIIHIFAPLQI